MELTISTIKSFILIVPGRGFVIFCNLHAIPHLTPFINFEVIRLSTGGKTCVSSLNS